MAITRKDPYAAAGTQYAGPFSAPQNPNTEPAKLNAATRSETTHVYDENVDNGPYQSVDPKPISRKKWVHGHDDYAEGGNSDQSFFANSQ